MKNQGLYKKAKLAIAEMSLNIVSSNLEHEFEINEPYRSFVSDSDKTDAHLKIYFNKFPDVGFGQKIFDSGGAWHLYASNGSRTFTLAPKIYGPKPIKVGIFNADFTEGEIYQDDKYFQGPEESSKKHPFPLSYPLDEVLMQNLLCRDSGITIHACGLKIEDKAYLFVGSSGSGKSVTANLWKHRKETLILSDDRIIIRQRQGKFWIFGTPWHGDAKLFSLSKALLQGIYFLKHNPKNEVRSLSTAEAASRLLVCSFPPFYDQRGMKNTLDLISNIAKKVPSYELGFVPDHSVISFLGDKLG